MGLQLVLLFVSTSYLMDKGMEWSREWSPQLNGKKSRKFFESYRWLFQVKMAMIIDISISFIKR